MPASSANALVFLNGSERVISAIFAYTLNVIEDPVPPLCSSHNSSYFSAQGSSSGMIVLFSNLSSLSISGFATLIGEPSLTEALFVHNSRNFSCSYSDRVSPIDGHWSKKRRCIVLRQKSSQYPEVLERSLAYSSPLWVEAQTYLRFLKSLEPRAKSSYAILS